MNSENLPATTSLSADQIQAVLAGQGAIDEADEGYGAIRMKVTGNTFQSPDDVWVSNPKSEEPAFVGRLMSAVAQYQGFWFDKVKAEKAGRPEMADRFCKSYYDNPNEKREYGTNGASCRACPYHPHSDEKQRCSWRGDIRFQILPDDGVLTGEEVMYELSLSMTGMIEYKGTRRDPMAGSATDKNFMARLAELSVTKAAEWECTPEQAIIVGLEALAEGMVAAEFRIVTMTNEELGRSWPVVSLNPIHVQKPEIQPALEAGQENTDDATPPATAATEEDNLPF
jgi:hypothetical protein